jgi:hypothetical protein
MEMAYRRNEIESKITALSDPITDHLIKILKWNDPINYKKHCNDIDKWLFKIQAFKLKQNRRPSQSDYFQWMFSDVAANELTVKRFIRGLHEYHHLPIIRDDFEVYDMLKAIFYQLSYDLHLNRFETILDYLPKMNKFEIDTTLIDRLDYFNDDPESLITLLPNTLPITKKELKQIIKHILIEDKELIEELKYV